MALSNIFNEPKKELTETAVGFLIVAGVIAVLVGIFFGGVQVCYWINPKVSFDNAAWVTFIYMWLAVVGFILLGVFLSIIHFIGEEFIAARRHRIAQRQPQRRMYSP